MPITARKYTQCRDHQPRAQVGADDHDYFRNSKRGSGSAAVPHFAVVYSLPPALGCEPGGDPGWARAPAH